MSELLVRIMSRPILVMNESTLVAALVIMFVCVIMATGAGAGIASTKHNLSVTGAGPVKATIEDRVCVFCHTPHNALGSIDGIGVPLWNHTLSTAAYIVPSSATLISSPQNPPDGDSKLCLSCHDGTVAIGSVVNSGSLVTTISMLGTGAGGVMPGVPGEAGSSNLGTDLSGHHPVSIEVNTSLVTDKKTQCDNDPLVTWRVCTPTAGSPVKLRPTNNSYGAGPHSDIGVQCTSCHDPHEDNPPGNNFLRLDNTGGELTALCLACHQDCSALCP